MINLDLDYSRDGACVIPSNVSMVDIESLRIEFASLVFKAGARPFTLSGLVRKLISPTGCFGSALPELGLTNARAVRVLAFDKTPESNWNLGWHQDRVIAVKERKEIAGFDRWTIKNTIPHVEAPANFLGDMFSMRLHLDDTDRTNGALKIIQGSAAKGKLTDLEVKECASKSDAVTCEARIGDILIMKALTVHASKPSQSPSHRRVLHIDYCTTNLPTGLNWALNL